MKECVIPMCKTSGKIDKKMSFHQFPSDEKRFQIWIQNINKANPLGSWMPNQYSTICGLHFMESDFKPFAKNRILKPDAVPTIFAFSKDSKQNVARLKRKRKASIPKKTPNKENISSDENMHLMDNDHTSGSAAEQDQAGSDAEQDQAGSEDEQEQPGFEGEDEAGSEEEEQEAGSEEEQEAGSEEEQDQAGSYSEQDQPSYEEQDQAGFEEEQGQAASYREDQAVFDRQHNETGSDAEYGQADSDAEHDQADSDAEHSQASHKSEKFQADSSYMRESNLSNTTYHSEKASKRMKVDPANISSKDIYPISNIKQIHTPKHLKTLIRESKIKCAEKKLALVKEKLASKVVSRALQKALVVSKIKAETAKTDFYERKKIFLLQTKISHLKNEVPVSEENFQTMEYLQSKIMEEELATRIEERALQKQLFEAEIQASNEKQTYYVTKKSWLPIFMDHSNMK